MTNFFRTVWSVGECCGEVTVNAGVWTTTGFHVCVVRRCLDFTPLRRVNAWEMMVLAGVLMSIVVFVNGSLQEFLCYRTGFLTVDTFALQRFTEVKPHTVVSVMMVETIGVVGQFTVFATTERAGNHFTHTSMTGRVRASVTVVSKEGNIRFLRIGIECLGRRIGDEMRDTVVEGVVTVPLQQDA